MQGAHASVLHSQPAALHTRNAGVDRVRAILTLTPTLTLAPQEPVCCCISALGTPCGLTACWARKASIARYSPTQLHPRRHRSPNQWPN